MGRLVMGRVALLFLLGVGMGNSVSHEPQEIFRVKSVEKYWSETGLRVEDLEELVQDHSCGSSLRYFLACVNAVSAVLYRSEHALSRTGEHLIAKPIQGSKEVTERQLLEPWRKIFLTSPLLAKKLSFERALSDAMALLTSEKATAISWGLNSFLSVFKDPHSYIVPIDYYYQVISKSSPKTKSLGFIISRTAQNYFIRKVFPQSPAAEAGLKKGDFLVEINEQSLADLSYARVNELIRTEDKSIKLKIKREKSQIDINIAKREVEIPSVTFEVVQKNHKLGILSINKFSKDSCSLTEKAFKYLISSRVEGVILDLRDNSGGQIEEASCIAGLLLGPDRKLFELHFFDPTREREVAYSDRDLVYGGPLAILVNRGSASASELLAGALRDHGRSLLVGETTFGKGSFQEGEIWKQNSKIALFSSKGFYILPSGFSPQMYGLRPDIEVGFMKDTQPRESEQYMYALFPPSGPHFPFKKMSHIRNCAKNPNREGVDQQLSKAEQVLFCIDPIAGVPNGHDGSL